MAAAGEVETVFNSITNSLKRAKSSKLQEEDVSRCLFLFCKQAKLHSTLQDELCSVSRSLSTPDHFLRRLLLLLVWIAYRLLPYSLCIATLLFPLYHVYTLDPCLASQLFPVAEFAMPVIDCSFCKGLTHAPEIHFSNITVDQFMEQYAYTSHPVLIKEAALSWPALELFSYDFFRQLYLKRPEAVQEDKESGQFFAYSSGIHNLEEFLNLSSDAATTKWYIGW